MAHIYIVEDDVNIREIEAFSLKNSGYTVEEFGSAKEFWSRIYEKVPDLIVLDVMLPDEDGLSIVKKLRQWAESRYVPIIMVTAKTTELDRVKGLDRGADDYLTKPFDMDVLTAKIQAILRRTYSFGTPGNVLEYKGIVLSPSRCTLTWNGNDIDLTKNELRILEILMEHAGKVGSRDAIMTKLWESDSFIDDNTLTVNITRLRRKLEKEGLKEFIITKKGLGYMV